MRFLSLFAGIGGFDLGLERAGMECVGQVENDEFCIKVLEKHWPHVKRMTDIRGVKGDEFGPIDLICGGVQGERGRWEAPALERAEEGEGGMSDYRVEVRVRNAPLMQAIERAGYSTVNEFCREHELSPGEVGLYANLKKYPVRDKDGEYRPIVLRMAKILRVLPEMLFPEKHLRAAFKHNRFHVDVDAADLDGLIENFTAVPPLLPDEAIEADELMRTLDDEIDSLPERTAQVLIHRFGLRGEEEKTLEEVGKMFDISRERVRQIERKAMRELGRKDRQKLRYLAGVAKTAEVVPLYDKKKVQTETFEKARAREEKRIAAHARKVEARQAAIESVAPAIEAVKRCIGRCEGALRMLDFIKDVETGRGPVAKGRWFKITDPDLKYNGRIVRCVRVEMLAYYRAIQDVVDCVFFRDQGTELQMEARYAAPLHYELAPLMVAA